MQKYTTEYVTGIISPYDRLFQFVKQKKSLTFIPNQLNVFKPATHSYSIYGCLADWLHVFSFVWFK